MSAQQQIIEPFRHYFTDNEQYLRQQRTTTTATATIIIILIAANERQEAQIFKLKLMARCACENYCDRELFIVHLMYLRGLPVERKKLPFFVAAQQIVPLL